MLDRELKIFLEDPNSESQVFTLQAIIIYSPMKPKQQWKLEQNETDLEKMELLRCYVSGLKKLETEIRDLFQNMGLCLLPCQCISCQRDRSHPSASALMSHNSHWWHKQEWCRKTLISVEPGELNNLLSYNASHNTNHSIFSFRTH